MSCQGRSPSWCHGSDIDGWCPVVVCVLVWCLPVVTLPPRLGQDDLWPVPLLWFQFSSLSTHLHTWVLIGCRGSLWRKQAARQRLQEGCGPSSSAADSSSSLRGILLSARLPLYSWKWTIYEHRLVQVENQDIQRCTATKFSLWLLFYSAFCSLPSSYPFHPTLPRTLSLLLSRRLALILPLHFFSPYFFSLPCIPFPLYSSPFYSSGFTSCSCLFLFLPSIVPPLLLFLPLHIFILPLLILFSAPPPHTSSA